MPELPEVEDARQDLEDFVRGKAVASCDPADDEKVIQGCTPAELKAALEGRTVDKVGRRGKNLWLQFSGEGPHLMIHLGMDGELLVRAADGKTFHRGFKYRAVAKNTSGQAWPPSHCKILINFADGTALAFDEWRRFGRLRLVDGPPEASDQISKLGFDPLSDMPPLGAFSGLLARRGKAKLKAVLLDQSFAAGIGNWVADEVLWHARLHPEQVVGELGADHVAALHAAIVYVVKTACEARADAARYPANWMFHSRWTNGKPGVLQGKKTAILTVGGRTSAFVPELQKMVKGGGFAAAAGDGKGGGAKAGGAKAGSSKAGAAKKPNAAAAKRAASSDSDSGSDEGPSSSGDATSSGGDGQETSDEAPPAPKAVRGSSGRGKGRAAAAAAAAAVTDGAPGAEARGRGGRGRSSGGAAAKPSSAAAGAKKAAGGAAGKRGRSAAGGKPGADDKPGPAAAAPKPGKAAAKRAAPAAARGSGTAAKRRRAA
ncbi:formamidopyrimidine-DNA glycosylase [Raphidocelis subcapitata]|uniref:Formamidopyrimidine-DNA glycosylase n=1 Tax=Raphidocelis subcapitata TaxID=307507 RepID=A0A2V0P270_9CHLO|nr:formamidopyrimidine-DNA glycosylase [Raphidocelis subcapitata]|eukprot:GBF93974.1 formamidopyrimidine-DNA glycosylase [Raphidocelis subcapitata]